MCDGNILTINLAMALLGCFLVVVCWLLRWFSHTQRSYNCDPHPRVPVLKMWDSCLLRRLHYWCTHYPPLKRSICLFYYICLFNFGIDCERCGRESIWKSNRKLWNKIKWSAGLGFLLKKLTLLIRFRYSWHFYQIHFFIPAVILIKIPSHLKLLTQ